MAGKGKSGGKHRKNERGAKKGPPRGKQPKTHAPKTRMAAKIRRRKIIEACLDGKNLREVAIETGLSPNTASQQVSGILKEAEVQGAFAMIMDEEGLTDKFLVNKVKSLLNARQVEYFSHMGEVTDERIVEALETQRKTLELAMKLKGHLREQVHVDADVGLMALVVQVMHSPGGELYEGEPQDVAETRREVPGQGGMRAGDDPANS